nr:ABC transporter substrate-binding protein [Alicyclobacillus hesperidum]
MQMKRKYVAGIAVAAAVVVAGGTYAGVASAGSSKTTTSLPGQASISSGTTLTVCSNPTPSWQDNFNPFDSSALGGTIGNVYQPLFYFDSVTGKQFNLLGTSFKFSDDNKTLTVQLRPNAKWQDGKAFTSTDVVFTFMELKRYPDADTNGIWQQLTSVKATGPHTVVFQFKTANIPFAETYVLGSTYIVPEAQWKSLGDPTKAKITSQNAIGTGPFKVSYFSPQDYKFTANPLYYGGKPKVQTLSYPAYGGNQGADLALASGQIQYGGIDIPNIETTFVKADPAHNHYYFPPSEPVELYPNLHNPLLAQLPVREAINDAINRNVLSTKGETGYEKPGTPTSLVLPNDQAWEAPDLTPSEKSFTVNDKLAIETLEKAGFHRGSDGIFEKNGQKLSFDLLTVSGWSDWDEDALLIKQQLQQVGIAVQVDQKDYAAYYNLIDPGKGQIPKYALAISWTNTGPTPYTTYYDMLDTNGNFNLEGFHNAAVDAALSNYSATTNLAQQKKDLYKVEHIVAQQLPVICLLDGALWYEYNDSQFTGFPTKQNLWIYPSPDSPLPASIVLSQLKPRT